MPTIEPTPPTITGITPDNGISDSDGVTNSPDVTVSGTSDVSDAFDTINLFDGTTQVGTTTADASGDWTVDPTLNEGTNDLTAVAVNAADVQSTSSADFVATLDTVPPTVSTVTDSDNNDNLAAGQSVTITVQMSENVFFTGSPSLLLSDSGTATYTGGEGSSTLTFSYTEGSAGATDVTLQGFGGTDISDAAGNALDPSSGNNDPICFMPGTLIATPLGEAKIEELRVGDLVLTSGGQAAPVRWIGRQTVSRRFGDPLRILPIRIAAGALGETLPARDLWLSPCHALLIDEVLVQAGALINGTTICRDSDVPEIFTYYHIELADHALVLAENVPAETFIDNVDRLAFDNWDEHEALYPSGYALAEMPYPRAKAARQVPRRVRTLVAARATVQGAAPGTKVA